MWLLSSSSGPSGTKCTLLSPPDNVSFVAAEFSMRGSESSGVPSWPRSDVLIWEEMYAIIKVAKIVTIFTHTTCIKLKIKVYLHKSENEPSLYCDNREDP
jgi:hypothetical protein